MAAQYMTRQELCDAVYQAVRAAAKPLSRLEICRAIGRSKAPHIIDMMEELAAGQWLVKGQSQDKWGRAQVVYSLGKETGLDCSTKS